MLPGNEYSCCSWTGECWNQDIRQNEDPRGGAGGVRGSAGGDAGASWWWCGTDGGAANANTEASGVGAGKAVEVTDVRRLELPKVQKREGAR